MLFISISAQAQITQPSHLSTAPLLLTPPLPSPTPTSTPYPVFDATVHVIPSTEQLTVGDNFDVRVSIDISQGCAYPIYELTLTQEGDQLPQLEYISPTSSLEGPGVSNPFTYTLRAIRAGTLTLDALAYGERNCGDAWNWQYVGGRSVPITITGGSNYLYLPIIQE